jgi:hypothetical protein
MKLLGGGKIRVRNATVAPKQADPEALSYGEYLVYPNPSTGIFNLRLPNSDQKVRIVISDLSGKTIAVENINEDHSEIIRVELRNVARGIYLMQVNNGQETFRTKLMLE